MTRFQALFIYFLRENCNCSWRAVAAHYYNRYNYDNSIKSVKDRIKYSLMTFGGNQIDGMRLCEESLNILEIITIIDYKRINKFKF